MKALVTAVMLAFATFAVQAAEPAKKVETKQEDNCVKKDKNGKCPPAPKGDKPTPKKVEKKEEAKK
jgi:hypothetical protein